MDGPVALAPAMASRGAGSIVSVSNMVAPVGPSAAAAYGGTKVALEAMSRAWAAEYSPRSVKINVVPGPVFAGTRAPRAFLEQTGAVLAVDGDGTAI
ncbi:MAG TPA: SDR family NAD(P)-dependent oxidoreductase [Solirubrobacterales bacterium]|nr:SDR family NAD(P)-dependent oxidoreductase [Solirubrobacterales bacterium]